jgi:nucleoside phosphorylase
VNGSGPMIAVTFALPAESLDFVRLLTNARRQSAEGVESIHGQISGRTVSVFHTGVGRKHCQAQVGKFLRSQPADCLISAGFAGALNNQLQVGSVFVAENFSSQGLLRFIGEKVLLGKLVTASGVVDSKAERDRLATNGGALAVDMETEFIAAACAAREIPMVSMRVISDTPSEPLPAPPDVLFDVERQRTNLGKLAVYLATHPAKVKELMGFRKRVVMVRRSLATALADLIGHI